MDFGEVLGRAWRIIWKHKILWIFGIFAGCSRGGGGGGNSYRGNVPNNGSSGQNPFPQFQQYANQFSDYIAHNLWVVVLFVLFILVVVAISLWLGTMGRIGLIKGTFKADGGAEHLGFAELWSESTPFFWRIFLLSLLIGLAFLVVLLPVIAAGVALSVVTLGAGLLCFIPLICVLALVGIAVGLLIQLAEPGIVLENLGIMDGLKRGWEVLKQNIGPVIIMWLILAVIGFIAGIVVAIPVLIAVIPAVVAFAATNSQGSNISYTPLIIAGLCCVAYFPVLLVLNGILTAYVQSAWTLTYMRLTNKPQQIVESPVIQAPNA